MRLWRNWRTTDSRGAAKSAEFFFRLMPRRAACALSRNSRTTDSRGAAKSVEFFFPLMPRRAACALFAALAILAGTCFPQQYDVLITGGRVADGSGSPWFYGDIAIVDDRIAAIGLLSREQANLHIDARGLTVVPGFIDIHNHGRQGILETPSAENLIRQGVTTLLDGNDGSSPVPLKPFLERVNKVRIAVNFGSFAGQGSIREKVMGLDDRRATPDELEGMSRIVRESMRDGAFGLSTGLFYVPGNFTPVEEIIELAKAAGKYGGMHISHMRDEAAEIAGSVRETIRIGEEGGLPTQISHHKVIGRKNWGLT
ncbi:MAG: amidohydrolase family protein, partial [Bryobacteraceae bacterium]